IVAAPCRAAVVWNGTVMLRARSHARVVVVNAIDRSACRQGTAVLPPVAESPCIFGRRLLQCRDSGDPSAMTTDALNDDDLDYLDDLLQSCGNDHSILDVNELD